MPCCDHKNEISKKPMFSCFDSKKKEQDEMRNGIHGLLFLFSGRNVRHNSRDDVPYRLYFIIHHLWSSVFPPTSEIHQIRHPTQIPNFSFLLEAHVVGCFRCYLELCGIRKCIRKTNCSKFILFTLNCIISLGFTFKILFPCRPFAIITSSTGTFSL